jgi:hypothetical protein
MPAENILPPPAIIQPRSRSPTRQRTCTRSQTQRRTFPRSQTR